MSTTKNLELALQNREHSRYVVLSSWLRLTRGTKADCKWILQRVELLRQNQKPFEGTWLKSLIQKRPDGSTNLTPQKQAAMELIALYHLAAAAETLARTMLKAYEDGDAEASYTSGDRDKMCKHFELAQSAAQHAEGFAQRTGKLQRLVGIIQRFHPDVQPSESFLELMKIVQLLNRLHEHKSRALFKVRRTS